MSRFMNGYVGRTLAILIVLCLILSLAAGCSNSLIAEDSVQENLPEIDPEGGVGMDISAVLYYRLAGENYLVPVTRNISVRANERAETAIIRTLLDGVPALSSNVNALFPSGAYMEDVTLEGGILYVTLSAAFMDQSALEELERMGASFENVEATQRAQEELYAARRLAVYSLVNTLTSYSKDIRVQFLVDVDNNGNGQRLTRVELGLESMDGAASDLIEPMTFDASVVITAESMVACMLTRMVNGEYELAYPLFLESDSSGAQKPTYADFETEMLSLGTITGFAILGSKTTANMTEVTVNLHFTNAKNESASIEGAVIRLKREGELDKIAYGSFTDILENR